MYHFLAVTSGAFIHVPPHVRVHGPALDYVGLFLLAILSGAGVNGLGEAALIAAGVYVARHHLPIEPVIYVAFLGALIGGTIGWAVGRHAGRRLLTVPGPLLRFRVRMLSRSEGVYQRYRLFAVFLTPAWAAGINKVLWRHFIPINACAAAIWACAIGLGSYYLGAHLTTDFSDEIGWVIGGVVALSISYQLLQHLLRFTQPTLSDFGLVGVLRR